MKRSIGFGLAFAAVVLMTYSVGSAEKKAVKLEGIKCPVSGKAAKAVDG